MLTFAVAVLGVALQNLFAKETLGQLDQLRHFTPLTMVDLLRDSLIDCAYDQPNNPLSFPCYTQPILADWPRVGHWAASVPFLAPVVAPFDVVWHLLFTRQVIPALLIATQIVLGLGISALILQRVRHLPDYWAAALLLSGTLFFGATATWMIMNAIPVLYSGLIFVVPGLPTAAVAAIQGALVAQCLIFGAALKLFVVDWPTKKLADWAIKLFKR